MRYLNHQIILKRRTDGLPCVGDFGLAEQWINGCGAGKALVRNYYLSADSAQKGWMGSAVNYASAVVGQPMRALAVGQVLASNAPDFLVGDFVTGWLGWQECACVTTDKIQAKVDPDVAPLRNALGALDLNGLTAYIALNDILSPDSKDTVLVSTAAGGVGSIVLSGGVVTLLGSPVVTPRLAYVAATTVTMGTSIIPIVIGCRS